MRTPLAALAFAGLLSLMPHPGLAQTTPTEPIGGTAVFPGPLDDGSRDIAPTEPTREPVVRLRADYFSQIFLARLGFGRFGPMGSPALAGRSRAAALARGLRPTR